MVVTTRRRNTGAYVSEGSTPCRPQHGEGEDGTRRATQSPAGHSTPRIYKTGKENPSIGVTTRRRSIGVCVSERSTPSRPLHCEGKNGTGIRVSQRVVVVQSPAGHSRPRRHTDPSSPCSPCAVTTLNSCHAEAHAPLRQSAAATPTKRLRRQTDPTEGLPVPPTKTARVTRQCRRLVDQTVQKQSGKASSGDTEAANSRSLRKQVRGEADDSGHTKQLCEKTADTQTRSLTVVVKDISKTTTHSTPRRSSRRTSIGEADQRQDTPVVSSTTRPSRVAAASSPNTPTGSTPVRRSRRLSDRGLEDTKGTTSKISFSIARILGTEGHTEGMNKQESLPAIEEDIEQPESKTSATQSQSQFTSMMSVSGDSQMNKKKSLPAIEEDIEQPESKTSAIQSQSQFTSMMSVSGDSQMNKQENLPAIKEDIEQPESKISAIQSQSQFTSEISVSGDSQMNKQESLPVIEDVEQPEIRTSATQSQRQFTSELSVLGDSPIKAEENSNMTATNEKDHSSLQDLATTAKVELPSCVSASNEQRTNEVTVTEKHTKDSNEGDLKCNNENLVLQNTEDLEDKKLQMECEENKENSPETELSREATEAEDKPDVELDENPMKQAVSKTSSSEAAILHQEKEECLETNIRTSAHIVENVNKEKEVSSTASLPTVLTNNTKAYKCDPELEKKIEQLKSIPRGLPVSGKWWKKDRQRFRSIYKDATGKKTWAKKMLIKQKRKEILARSAAIEAEKQKKKEDLRERQRMNKIRREENAKKSEIVQVIKDPRKIKKMKRKQLRYIETRDTANLKTV